MTDAYPFPITCGRCRKSTDWQSDKGPHCQCRDDDSYARAEAHLEDAQRDGAKKYPDCYAQANGYALATMLHKLRDAYDSAKKGGK